jgi:hypothetical protein
MLVALLLLEWVQLALVLQRVVQAVLLAAESAVLLALRATAVSQLSPHPTTMAMRRASWS